MKNVFAVLIVLVVAACTFQTKHRGYVFPSDLEAKVAEIKTTAQLVEQIGAPQVKTIHGKQVWVYYGVDENYRGPLAPTFTDETVLLVWVDGARVVKTQVLHDVKLPDVELAKGETQIPAAIELNALEELFNNIGRFSPAGLGQ
jgi:outer membrane protein assembly factor BamE (lipoprotein component of BamABCDE complex)